MRANLQIDYFELDSLSINCKIACLDIAMVLA